MYKSYIKTINKIINDNKVDETTNDIQNLSLNIHNNNLSYNTMTSNVDNTIEQKRKRGRPSKPTKIDKDLPKLKEIPVNGQLNNFTKIIL